MTDVKTRLTSALNKLQDAQASDTTPTTHTSMALPDEKVGDIQLIGCYGGAICAYWRIDAIQDGIATLTKVRAESVKNDDGTFSTRWVNA